MSPFPMSGPVIAAIKCLHCAGNSHLVRRSPDPADNRREIRTFACAKCDRHTELAV